jgi:molybdopterin molybdotransferase
MAVMAVLSYKDARSVVEEHARKLTPVESELVSLEDADRRVLAQDITADRDLPPFPRATRDGFALRACDVGTAPAQLRVFGEVRAGADPDAMGLAIEHDTAVEIMTGAPVPRGADAVVMVEYTRREGDRVVVERSVAAGENVVPAGSEARAGSVVLTCGMRLDAAAIAVAASVGGNQVRVHKRPRVAILSTGDEVVEVAAQPGPTQIRNSNSYALAAQVRAAAGHPVLLPIAPDEPGILRKLLEEGLAADLLVITGGVSMGRYDLVEQALEALHAEFFFTGALIQPGRPVVFGCAPKSAPVRADEKTYFLGLPGNPVSTMVTFELFARPMLDALSGGGPCPLRFLHAKLAKPVRVKPGLTRFLPARLSGELESTTVELVAWQGSGDVFSVARANCWLVVPPDRDQMQAGEWASVLLRH